MPSAISTVIGEQYNFGIFSESSLCILDKVENFVEMCIWRLVHYQCEAKI